MFLTEINYCQLSIVSIKSEKSLLLLVNENCSYIEFISLRVISGGFSMNSLTLSIHRVIFNGITATKSLSLKEALAPQFGEDITGVLLTILSMITLPKASVQNVGTKVIFDC